MAKKPVGLKDFKTEMVPVADLLPYVNNPKAHPAGQVDKIASSIKNFGFLVPLVIDSGNEIVAGHGRLAAAQKLGLGIVPCVRADNLTPAQVRAFRIMDNRVQEQSEWFPETLALELKALEEMDFDLGLTGFDLDELEGFGISGGDPPPEAPGPGKGKLSDRFGIPPFSVLNAREGWWQDRKRAWLALGIQSEIGRGATILNDVAHDSGIKTECRSGIKKFKEIGGASPGGSPRPACDYSKKQRGDGHGRPITGGAKPDLG